MASSQKPSGNTIIVGIDFGTTYSGVAFRWSQKIERMEVIASWDSDMHSTSDEEKTPTAIAFDSKNKVSWGYSIPFDAEQVKWFKLLLIDDKDLPDDVRESIKIKEARAYLQKHNKTAIEVRIIETVSRNLVNYSKFHIVITVPAIWPEYARGRMREAAKNAGMLTKRIAGATKLTCISEPEAAALATLSDMNDRSDIKAGDSFVVVDCGGGTVDLISYEVLSIAPMVVKECVQGQGGLCGAVFVDENFIQILEQKFGAQAWRKLENETRQRLVHDEWEHGIKPMFDGRARTWVFPMPFECIDMNSMRVGSSRPKITLTAVHVCSAFDPVVNKICAMVEEQVAAIKVKKKKDPKYILMVGGFGRCKYLFTALKGRFGNGKDIEVLQSRGSGPWTAICRGAVTHAANIHGLPTFSVDVQTRIARCSYGIEWSVPWDEDLHNPQDKQWDEDTQAWEAKEQMKWFLKMGDDMSATEPVKMPMYQLYALDEATTMRPSEEIWVSTTSPPPKRRGSNVSELCSIEWHTEIDIASLPTFTNSLGKVFYELKFVVETTCAAGLIDFAIYHNKKRQASRSVVVDNEIKAAAT